MSDFREVNKWIARNPLPIPKISTVLQELERFTYVTALDLNMGYYTIRLDLDLSIYAPLFFCGEAFLHMTSNGHYMFSRHLPS